MESTDHLFFRSDMASLVWGFLCPLFVKKRPASLQDFMYEWGVRQRLRSFTDRLGFGLASCALWEIWKARCSRMYESQASPFNKGNVLRWAGILSKLIGTPCDANMTTVRICDILNIVTPLPKDFKVVWRSWDPHISGNTCNIAIHSSVKASSMAVIMRDRSGRFLVAMKASSTSKDPIKCLLQILSEVKNSGIEFSCIKTSSIAICDIGKFADVDWSNFQVQRKVVKLCKGVEVYRVCPAQNRPAEALCFAPIRYLKTTEISSLPMTVTRALNQDFYSLPCSFYDQRVYM